MKCLNFCRNNTWQITCIVIRRNQNLNSHQNIVGVIFLIRCSKVGLSKSRLQWHAYIHLNKKKQMKLKLIKHISFLLLLYIYYFIYFYFLVRYGCSQDLLLAMCSKITPDRPYRVLGIEPQLAKCRPYPLYCFFFFSLIRMLFSENIL